MKIVSRDVAINMQDGINKDNINDLKALTAGMKGNDRINLNISHTIEKTDTARQGKSPEFTYKTTLIFTNISESRLDKFLYQAKKLKQNLLGNKSLMKSINEKNSEYVKNISAVLPNEGKIRNMATLPHSMSVHNFRNALDAMSNKLEENTHQTRKEIHETASKNFNPDGKSPREIKQAAGSALRLFLGNEDNKKLFDIKTKGYQSLETRVSSFETKVLNILNGKGLTSLDLENVRSEKDFREEIRHAQPYMSKALFDHISEKISLPSVKTDVKSSTPDIQKTQETKLPEQENISNSEDRQKISSAYRQLLLSEDEKKPIEKRSKTIESQAALFANEVAKLINQNAPINISKDFFVKIQSILERSDASSAPDSSEKIPNQLIGKILDNISEIDTDDIDTKIKLMQMKGVL